MKFGSCIISNLFWKASGLPNCLNNFGSSNVPITFCNSSPFFIEVVSLTTDSVLLGKAKLPRESQTASVKTRTFNHTGQLQWPSYYTVPYSFLFGVTSSQMPRGKCFLALRRVFVDLFDINTLGVEGHRQLQCKLDILFYYILFFDGYTAWHCLLLFSSMF